MVVYSVFSFVTTTSLGENGAEETCAGEAISSGWRPDGGGGDARDKGGRQGCDERSGNHRSYLRGVYMEASD